MQHHFLPCLPRILSSNCSTLWYFAKKRATGAKYSTKLLNTFLLNWIQSRCSFLELSKWKILSHLSLKKIFVWIHQISIFGQEKWLVNFVFLVLPSMFYFRRWRRLLCKNFWVCWLCGGNRTWHLHKMLELRNHLPAAASPLTTFLSPSRVAPLA